VPEVSRFEVVFFVGRTTVDVEGAEETVEDDSGDLERCRWVVGRDLPFFLKNGTIGSVLGVADMVVKR
jgi:hypothetical protein